MRATAPSGTPSTPACVFELAKVEGGRPAEARVISASRDSAASGDAFATSAGKLGVAEAELFWADAVAAAATEAKNAK